jgi:hypothetical protein
VFVAEAERDIKALINRSLNAVRRAEHSTLTALADGCHGLRHILSDAGVTDLPFLDASFQNERPNALFHSGGCNGPDNGAACPSRPD